ncbi:hypothetical protein [Rhodococcus sp. APC 3903]|nr:hypothetical protein [Rhodococcus sp. APC 3903]MDN3460761.1 hypothetical protein [Rhodococcus sp. APC 3903]
MLDRNIFEIPVDQIGGTEVLRTLFEGRTVFDAHAQPSATSAQ